MLRHCPIAVLLVAAWHTHARADSPELHYPRIANYGGVMALANAAEQPRPVAKIVFDITAAAPADRPHRGLEAVARYLNLHALAGHADADVQLALVLHGAATQVALDNQAYARVTSAQGNPNLELVRQLQACGVEIFVCGQSLMRHQYPVEGVDKHFTIAVSAMSVNANRQADGYSYLCIP